MNRRFYILYLVVLVFLSSCAAGLNCPTYSHSTKTFPKVNQQKSNQGGVFEGGF